MTCLASDKSVETGHESGADNVALSLPSPRSEGCIHLWRSDSHRHRLLQDPAGHCLSTHGHTELLECHFILASWTLATDFGARILISPEGANGTWWSPSLKSLCVIECHCICRSCSYLLHNICERCSSTPQQQILIMAMYPHVNEVWTLHHGALRLDHGSMIYSIPCLLP